MLIFRCTAKALKKLKEKPISIEVDKSDFNLGEWYINTVESIKRGGLFLAAMHADSFYTMFLPVKRNMKSKDLINTFFTNLILRLIQIGIPNDIIEKITMHYNEHIIFAKTNSKNRLATLNSILQDTIFILKSDFDKFIRKDNDFSVLENRINSSLRTLGKGYISPLPTFYNCIRTIYPELNQKIDLEMGMILSTKVFTDIFKQRVSEQLLQKIKQSSSNQDILFNYEEVKSILSILKTLNL